MEIHEAASTSDRTGPMGTPGYQPIENYGIIGDLHTTALVGMNGSIDWLCLPHHDSPSVFAAILDDTKGGWFRISPDMEGATCKQLYWPDTNVLVTRFFTPDGSLQLMYGIDGRQDLTEETLDHLEGYRGSRPVRLGNGAYDQLQLDIYGELMDAVYLYNKHGSPISYDLWTHLRSLINWVCDNWQNEDEGIWETRGGRRDFVYSRLMCWVAIDRGLRLADKRSFPADRERWLEVRDRIYEEIMEKGWSPEREAFVQSYGGDTLDASSLIMPLVFFLSPSDPRMLRTLDAINRPPKDGGLVSNSLVYRYDVQKSADGLTGEEGTFSLCTFWLVEALTRAGRLEESRLIFEHMLGYANHLGLYAEEIGHRGEVLGNFPQAFTHLTLISAAHNLDRALGSRG